MATYEYTTAAALSVNTDYEVDDSLKSLKRSPSNFSASQQVAQQHKAVLTESAPHHLLVLLRPLDSGAARVIVAGPEAAVGRGIGQDDEGPLLLQGRETVFSRPEVGHVDPPASRAKKGED